MKYPTVGDERERTFLGYLRLSQQFQFLGRNSGRSDDKPAAGTGRDTKSFNSSVGILVVRTTMMREVAP